MEPGLLRSETGRNPLRIKDCDGIWNTQLPWGIQQLRKNRQKLLDLAAEYDAGIAKLEPRPSEATRNFRKET
jgi:hypothetical protein